MNMNERKTSYTGNAPVSSRDRCATETEVVFYQLSRKFVDDECSVPDETKEVMYYTLSVGHHTGVIDCFEECLRCPLRRYQQIVGLIEEESARYKLEGIMRHGEIQINAEHLDELLPAVRGVLVKAEKLDVDADDVCAWLCLFIETLDRLADNHVAYIMGRVREV